MKQFFIIFGTINLYVYRIIQIIKPTVNLIHKILIMADLLKSRGTYLAR